MTSVDSGVETSNNSDDSSIAQNEDMTTDESSSGSSALATIITNQTDHREIKPFDIEFSSVPWCWSDIPFKISPLSSVNENFTYPHEIDSSIPTSSSKLVVASPSVMEIKFPHTTSLSPDYSCCRKIRSSYATGKRFHDDKPYNRFAERRMRIAAATNNTIMMKRLLCQGASPNNCDFRGRTPLHLACCRHHRDFSLPNLLVRPKSKDSPLIFKTRGYTEMVRLLLQHGADPNLRDCVGNTPLHLAAVTSKSVVTLLLNAGVNPDCLDQDGYNPLQLVQTKLHLLQNCKSQDSAAIKEEVQNIVSMLLAYLQKHKDSHKNVEALSTFCSRLSLSSTSEHVQDDVKDLLAHLDALSITQ